MKNAFLVLGGAQTRWGEVHRLRLLARREFQAALVLAKPGVVAEDLRVADRVVACDLAATETGVLTLNREMHGAGFKIIGVLPMAAEAVALAAGVAAALGLPRGVAGDGAEVGVLNAGVSLRHSWDHCPSHAWITAVEGLAEQPDVAVQYVVPALVAGASRRRIHCAGVAAARGAGWQGGAAHVDLGAGTDGGRVVTGIGHYPADMRVWDLAENAYPRRNPWLSWLRWATGADVPFILENENPARCFVGLRMVKAPADGVIERLPRGHVDHRGLIRWAYLKEEGDVVVAEPRRREDFVGYVMLRAFDYEELCVELRRMAEFIEGGVGVMRSAVLGGVSTAFDDSILPTHECV